MTRAALDLLERDEDGFFLLVEGSKIDWANHTHHLIYMLGEMLAFDEAVKVVKDWIDAEPSRKDAVERAARGLLLSSGAMPPRRAARRSRSGA